MINLLSSFAFKGLHDIALKMEFTTSIKTHILREYKQISRSEVRIYGDGKKIPKPGFGEK